MKDLRVQLITVVQVLQESQNFVPTNGPTRVSLTLQQANLEVENPLSLSLSNGFTYKTRDFQLPG